MISAGHLGARPQVLPRELPIGGSAAALAKLGAGRPLPRQRKHHGRMIQGASSLRERRRGRRGLVATFRIIEVETTRAAPLGSAASTIGKENVVLCLGACALLGREMICRRCREQDLKLGGLPPAKNEAKTQVIDSSCCARSKASN